jgi:hypothetical protein
VMSSSRPISRPSMGAHSLIKPKPLQNCREGTGRKRLIESSRGVVR